MGPVGQHRRQTILSPMTFCLVTDRRRVAGANATLADARRCLVAQARHAVAVGIHLIQLRERDLEAADLAEVTRDLLGVTRGTSTRVVVNDRLDVALACGADGVHLRGDSIPIGDARRIAPEGFLVGRSIRSPFEAAQAAGADYLIAGTVFATRSKPAAQTLLGLDGLRAIVSAASVPVLAIGGIGVKRCDGVAGAGAAGIAAIGLFMAAEADADGRTCRAIPLADIVERVRARFDSVERRP
jgi:thiamine-phosphate diphosphorylase